jgi:hypothetical protein
MGTLILIFGAPGMKSGEFFVVQASEIPLLQKDSSQDCDTLYHLRAAIEEQSHVLKCWKFTRGDISSDKKILNNSVF